MNILLLLPTIHWILEMIEPLQNYSVNKLKCLTMIVDIFVKESSKFWLHFIQNQFLKSLIKVFRHGSSFNYYMY